MRYQTQSRTSDFGYMDSITPGVKWLLITNIAIFVPYYLFAGSGFSEALNFLALSPRLVVFNFMIWQLGTYLFLHGSILHILFNMLGLWMFGTILERDWGTRRFLKYYFICGIGAGLCDVLLHAVRGSWNTSTIGASGAIYGLLLAFGVLYPNMIVLMFFIIPIRAKYMVMIFGAIAFLNSFSVNRGVSDIAHLGGMVFGYAYLRFRFFNVDLNYFRREYETWKMKRAKRKFEVYMKRRGTDDDRWTH